jgi:hypothetical protein
VAIFGPFWYVVHTKKNLAALNCKWQSEETLHWHDISTKWLATIYAVEVSQLKPLQEKSLTVK